MRTVALDHVTRGIRQAVQELNFNTPGPVLARLVQIRDRESPKGGREAMEQIVENRRIAAEQRTPMCQDTGMVVVFAEVGQDVRLEGGTLENAIAEGVREGSADGFLRSSVVRDPLFDRTNTGDNTPPVLHVRLVSGDRLRLHVAAKGFGAENMSRVRMLTPAAVLDDLKAEVIRCVEHAGPNACPPVVVGVGVGGTLEKAALLAKWSLMRPIGERHPERRYAALEVELLDQINALGIGPQGWGGVNTALDVRIEYHAAHIAGVPVAVNLDCHLHRHLKLDF